MWRAFRREFSCCPLWAIALVLGTGCGAFADFRFTLTGDPRSDLPRWVWTLSEMADKVGDEGVFHITAGDYYEDGAVTRAADFYETLKAQFGDDVIWYPTVGNHELEEGGPDLAWLRNFYDAHLAGTVNPGPGPSPCHKTTYSWDYRNAHFVQLNMYYDGTTDDEEDGAFSDALYDWLLEDLNRNTKPVVFVVYHEPAYPNGRGDKDSPPGWQRFWKLLNDRKVVAGLCADTHTYARYQVDGDWETFTWELDAGNAGRMSHGDTWQTFVDIAVDANGLVRFDTWQAEVNEPFVMTDTWTAVAVTVKLVGPADGATVDANGAVLTCELIPGALCYQLLLGPQPDHMTYISAMFSEPPTDVIQAFPFEQTWWTVRYRSATGHTVDGTPRLIRAENVQPPVVENLATGAKYPHVQQAIDEAEDGDEIVVGGGRWQYLENVEVNIKGLSLRSKNPDDPAVVAATVINGRNNGPAITLSSCRYDSAVEGLTLTGGTTGIYIYDSCPAITKCNIINNKGDGIKWWPSRGCMYPLIANCFIAGNEGDGLNLERTFYPIIVNCIIAGNLRFGVYGPRAVLRNCTIVGNRWAGVAYYETSIANCIVHDNNDPEIRGLTTVSYSNVKGGWAGTGNIDADPCFLQPGYWDANGAWITGDYHLLLASACIDAGDNGSIPADSEDLDRDGNTVEPIPWDFDAGARIVDGDNDGNSIVDMGAHEFSMPPIEVSMKFTPQSFNPGSQGRYVKAHIVLPEGFTVEDVDTNAPATLQPHNIHSAYINAFVNESGLTELEIGFDRSAFCNLPSFDGTVRVEGSLTSGLRFCGTDTIRITNNTLKSLAGVASCWLQNACFDLPSCGEFDFNQDCLVNFPDFARLETCCVEITTQ